MDVSLFRRFRAARCRSLESLIQSLLKDICTLLADVAASIESMTQAHLMGDPNIVRILVDGDSPASIAETLVLHASKWNEMGEAT